MRCIVQYGQRDGLIRCGGVVDKGGHSCSSFTSAARHAPVPHYFPSRLSLAAQRRAPSQANLVRTRGPRAMRTARLPDMRRATAQHLRDPSWCVLVPWTGLGLTRWGGSLGSVCGGMEGSGLIAGLVSAWMGRRVVGCVLRRGMDMHRGERASWTWRRTASTHRCENRPFIPTSNEVGQAGLEVMMAGPRHR
jgi:hypothetical protein